MSFVSSRARALAITAACAVGLAVAPAAAAKSGPYSVSFATSIGYSLFINSNVDPPGANVWSCKPSAAHPRPVVLVHGTWENRYDNWAYISPSLKAAGYCVFALDYGVDRTGVGAIPGLNGTADITKSAKELATYVDQVRGATGSAQVDLVGHSQGGMMPRQYLKYEGGAGKVKHLIALGATNNGTTLSGIGTLGDQLHLLGVAGPILGVAAMQQLKDSTFIQQLNAGGYTVPGTAFTTIATKYDEVTTPYASTFFPAGPGATVTNITLQTGCLIDLSDHLSMSYGARALWFIKKALDPTLRGSAPCLFAPPVV